MHTWTQEGDCWIEAVQSTDGFLGVWQEEIAKRSKDFNFLDTRICLPVFAAMPHALDQAVADALLQRVLNLKPNHSFAADMLELVAAKNISADKVLRRKTAKHLFQCWFDKKAPKGQKHLGKACAMLHAMAQIGISPPSGFWRWFFVWSKPNLGQIFNEERTMLLSALVSFRIRMAPKDWLELLVNGYDQSRIGRKRMNSSRVLHSLTELMNRSADEVLVEVDQKVMSFLLNDWFSWCKQVGARSHGHVTLVIGFWSLAKLSYEPTVAMPKFWEEFWPILHDCVGTDEMQSNLQHYQMIIHALACYKRAPPIDLMPTLIGPMRHVTDPQYGALLLYDVVCWHKGLIAEGQNSSAEVLFDKGILDNLISCALLGVDILHHRLLVDSLWAISQCDSILVNKHSGTIELLCNYVQKSFGSMGAEQIRQLRTAIQRMPDLLPKDFVHQFWLRF